MPAPKARVGNLNEVPEEHRKFYVEVEGGGAELNVEAYVEHEKQPIVGKRTELLGKLTKYKDIPEDKLPAIRDWLAQQADDSEDDDDETPAPRKKPEEAPEKKPTLAEKRAKRLEAEKAELAAKVEKQEAEFRRYRLDTYLNGEALSGEVIPERLESWKKTVGEMFSIDAKGRTIFLEDGEESDIPAQKAIREVLRERYPWFYKPTTGTGGGGSENGGGGTNPGGNKKKADFTKAEKLAFIGEHGFLAWDKLPE